MRLMQKTYLFPVQTGMPLANAYKICRIHGYSTLPTIGNAVNVHSPDIGKPDIFRRKGLVSRHAVNFVIFSHPEKTVTDLPKLLCS
jgi:hypothetical protein